MLSSDCRGCSLAGIDRRSVWRPRRRPPDRASRHSGKARCATRFAAARSVWTRTESACLPRDACLAASLICTNREGIANLLLAVPEGHDDSDDDDDDGMDDGEQKSVCCRCLSRCSNIAWCTADALDTDAHLTVAVSALPHTEQIRAATAYDDLREAMRSMIAKRCSCARVLRAASHEAHARSLSGGRREIGMEDVDAFKADLARRKRRKGDDE